MDLDMRDLSSTALYRNLCSKVGTSQMLTVLVDDPSMVQNSVVSYLQYIYSDMVL